MGAVAASGCTVGGCSLRLPGGVARQQGARARRRPLRLRQRAAAAGGSSALALCAALLLLVPPHGALAHEGGGAAPDTCPLPANVTVEQLAAALERGGVLDAVVDVRTRSEYLGAGLDAQRDGIGRVPGAILVDSLATAPERAAQLEGCSRRGSLAVICRTGVRSLVAQKQLQAKGFGCVANVLGGSLAWAEAGYVVERGEPEGGLPPLDQYGGDVCTAESRRLEAEGLAEGGGLETSAAESDGLETSAAESAALTPLGGLQGSWP